MTVHTTRHVDDVTPVTYATDAREVAQRTYDDLLGLLELLGPADWEAPTECTGWTVADVVRHLIGAAKSNASMREMIRQTVHGQRHKARFGGNSLDATNDLQVRDHDHLAAAELLAELRRVAPLGVAGRMRTPRPLRRVRLPVDTGGSAWDGMPTDLTLGHLNEVVYTRDVWLHRIDIARATGRALDLGVTDRRIVEDVVREWAGRHGQPFALTLTGPAGGRFRQGDGGVELERDAVGFCRVLSGREHGEGLLATGVLF